MDDLLDHEQNSPFLLDLWGSGKHEHALAYDIEEWYEQLKENTFPTEFLELSMAEADAMVTVHRLHAQNRPHEIPEDTIKKLQELEERVDRHLKEMQNKFKFSFPASSKGFFIRLSSRSPKDAGFDEVYKSQIVELIARYIKEQPIQSYYSDSDLNHLSCSDISDCRIPSENSVRLPDWKTQTIVDDWNLNRILVANYHSNLFYQALSEVLCIQNGSQACKLLTKSERTYHDLVYERKYPETWRMQIIVRQWDTRVRLDREFRCFVCCGVLSAISQYNLYSYYPNLMLQQGEIRDAIIGYHKKIAPSIHYQTYVIDFLVTESNEVVVVELNPFSNSTGGCLFQWEYERRELQGGNDVWGDLEAWEEKYGIKYSDKEKEDIAAIDYPIIKIREVPFQSIIDYCSLQDDTLNLVYQKMQNEASWLSHCQVL